MLTSLGVFETIYGADAVMSIDKALLISVVGFLIVFIMLGILALFVKGMGRVFDTLMQKKKPAPVVPNHPSHSAAPAVPQGTPLPDGVSAGEIRLSGVSDEEAACVMAIVSHKTGIPLNRLQFNSIALKEDETK